MKRSPDKTWYHLYHVFKYIYSLPIKKDICHRQNVSIKLPFCLCVLFIQRSLHSLGVCFSSRDLFILWVRVSFFFSYFLCYPYFGTFLSILVKCSTQLNILYFTHANHIVLVIQITKVSYYEIISSHLGTNIHLKILFSKP